MDAKVAKRTSADLNDVRVFLDALRAGSFSAAARELALPPSTISRRVARLEVELGARLFQRSARALTLTEAGRTYAAYAERALSELSTAQQAIGDLAHAPRGRVRISAPVGMGAMLWTALEGFLRDFADVRVEIDLSDRFVDLAAEGFDMSIRSRPDVGPDLIGRRLVGDTRQLFASPRYVEERGQPRTVRALADHDCVILGPHADRASWTLHSGGAPLRVKVRGRVAVNEAQLAARMAASGMGIVLLARSLCEGYVREGKLIRVLPRVSGGETSIWLVYPDRRLPAAARAVADFLVRELPPLFARR
jgi:DNA-binding transcriptional LysR family regulator